MKTMKLEDLKSIAAGKATADEIKEKEEKEVLERLTKANKANKANKKKSQKSGEWIKTDWWWRWEWEKDKDWRPIMRKECDSATMYHIDKPSWVYEEWEWKDIKQYDVWCIRFKRTWEEIYAYKKDWKLNQVKFVEKEFDLANRLYITWHAYQQKDSKAGGSD